jgi:hypothetical protein
MLQLSLTWRKTIQELLLLGHSFFPTVCDIVEMVIRKRIWCISLKIITNLWHSGMEKNIFSVHQIKC